MAEGLASHLAVHPTGAEERQRQGYHGPKATDFTGWVLGLFPRQNERCRQGFLIHESMMPRSIIPAAPSVNPMFCDKKQQNAQQLNGVPRFWFKQIAMPAFLNSKISVKSVKSVVKSFSPRREWWNGRHARLRIWSRKGWRFESSLAHQTKLRNPPP